jgi:ABC-type phosphate transport system substrate-binding protein
MKTIIDKRCSFYITILFTVITFLLPAIAVRADNLEKSLRGETFTDSSKTFPMPEEWIKKTIKYEKDAENADISIVMDQDIYHTLLPLIQKYGRDNNLKIKVKEGTCGITAGMLAAKTVDIGGFCCPASKEDRLPGLRFHTLGIVGKAFFIHPSNPVESITSIQLREIYRGRIYRWSEVNGPNWTIKAIGRLHCQARPGHWRQLLDKDKEFSPRLNEVGSIPDMISQVVFNKEAIGWEVLTMVEHYRTLGRVKILKIDGYGPNDSKALSSLKYPFYRTYNITTWEGKGVENARAGKLAEHLIKEFEKLDPNRVGFVSQSHLRKKGWRFKGDELVGEPLK